MKKVAWALALGAMGVAASAQAKTVRAQDPATLVAAMQEYGLRAELTKDGTGDPMIRSAVNGSRFDVYFYNCTDNTECATVQLHAGYDHDGVTLEKINEWNRSQRFGRAYLDTEDDPIIEMDIDLDDGGMSQELFIDNLEFWESIVDKFEKEIGFDD